MNRLTSFIVLALVLLLQACGPMQTIVVVRHGEKAADGITLSEKGKLRAESLKTILSAKRLDSVYSTNTARTINTGKPTADNKNLPVILYRNNTDMVSILDRNSKKGSFLVVGHSNTVPDLLRLCGCDYKKKDLGDDEYDRLFIMKRNAKKCTIRESSY